MDSNITTIPTRCMVKSLQLSNLTKECLLSDIYSYRTEGILWERLTLTDTDSYICWRSSVSITTYMTLIGFEHQADTKPFRVDIYQYRVNVNAVPVRTNEKREQGNVGTGRTLCSLCSLCSQCSRCSRGLEEN